MVIRVVDARITAPPCNNPRQYKPQCNLDNCDGRFELGDACDPDIDGDGIDTYADDRFRRTTSPARCDSNGRWSAG